MDILFKLNMLDSIDSWFQKILPQRIYDGMPKALVSIASVIVILIIGFQIGNFAGKLVVKLLEKHNVDKTVHYFLSRCVTVFIKIMFVVMALSQIGFNISSFIAALGAAGVTAGLGLKDCISQFASGIQILFNKPFKSGDYVEVEGISGTIDAIHFMNTTMITLENKIVTVPNSYFTTKSIINYTAQDTRRIDLVFPVRYGEDIPKAKGVLYRAARDNPNILDEPKPYVAVQEYAGSSINLVCQVWCRSNNYFPSFYTMQEDVKEAFDKNGIEIPFEQVDIHVKNEK